MTAARLRLGVALSGGRVTGWREGLARALTLDGHTVGFLPGIADPEPPGVGLIETLEGLIYGDTPRQAAAPPESAVDAFDFTVSGGDGLTRLSKEPQLELRCDGAPFSVGLARALLDMRGPVLEVVLRQRGGGEPRLVASGRAALEEPHRWLKSRAQVEATAIELVRGVIRRLARDGAAPSALSLGPVTAATPGALDFAMRVIRAGVSRRLRRLVKQDPRWRVCWRRLSGDEVAERGAWPAFSYREIPDDGQRFFADPFVFAHAGRTFIFCEEFPFATRRGIISVVEVADGKVVGPPRPALDPGHHTSYPMIFERDGSVWMIPETSQAGRIELWRAERLPDRWILAGILVDGVAASDATLHESAGKLWLLASVSEMGSSSWDSLHAWCADRLEGPWTPHALNPLLIDSSCARPAGMPFRQNGRWVRPVQDCRTIYGGGLALCAIDRLDEAGFEQTVLTRLGPPPGLAAIGAHTLNAAAGIETIDVFKPSRADIGRWDSDAALSRFGQEKAETSSGA